MSQSVLKQLQIPAARDEDEPDSNNTDSLSEDAQAGDIRPDQVEGRQFGELEDVEGEYEIEDDSPVVSGTNGHGTMAIITADGEAVVADTNIALDEEGLGMTGRQFHRAHVRGGAEYEEEPEEEEDVDASSSSSHAEFPCESENPDRWIEEHLIEGDMFESSEEASEIEDEPETEIRANLVADATHNRSVRRRIAYNREMRAGRLKMSPQRLNRKLRGFEFGGFESFDIEMSISTRTLLSALYMIETHGRQT